MIWKPISYIFNQTPAGKFIEPIRKYFGGGVKFKTYQSVEDWWEDVYNAYWIVIKSLSSDLYVKGHEFPLHVNEKKFVSACKKINLQSFDDVQCIIKKYRISKYEFIKNDLHKKIQSLNFTEEELNDFLDALEFEYRSMLNQRIYILMDNMIQPGKEGEVIKYLMNEGISKDESKEFVGLFYECVDRLIRDWLEKPNDRYSFIHNWRKLNWIMVEFTRKISRLDVFVPHLI